MRVNPNAGERPTAVTDLPGQMAPFFDGGHAPYEAPDPDAPACYLEYFADVAMWRGETEVAPTVVFEGKYPNLEFSPASDFDASWFVYLNPTATEPANTRLLLAMSDDGVNWYKTGLVIANHGGVSCVAVEGGVLYVFFNSVLQQMTPALGVALAATGVASDVLSMAYSADLRTWSYRIVGATDNPAAGVRGIVYNRKEAGASDPTNSPPNAADPSVAQIADGSGWYLFYTLRWNPGLSATFVATSPRLDALPWTQLDGRVFPVEMVNGNAEDASLTRVEWPDGTITYQYAAAFLAGAGGGSALNWLVTLDRSLNVVEDAVQIATYCGGRELRLDNPHGQDAAVGFGVGGHWPAAGVDQSVRWYATVMDPTMVTDPYITAQTVDVVQEGSPAIGPTSCTPVLVQDRDYEYRGVRGAAVARFGSCWVMVYETQIEPPDGTEVFVEAHPAVADALRE